MHRRARTTRAIWQRVGWMLAVMSAIGFELQGWAQGDSRDPNDSDSVVKIINEQIAESWNQFEIPPSTPATDGEWCRRLFIDVIGRIPTADELGDFLADRSSAKRAALVDQLIRSPRYSREYTRHWATYWMNVLIGRTGGTRRRDACNRRGLRDYLEDRILKNVPYDQMASELITATGTTVPQTENFNGASNFLVDMLGDRATQATSQTSQVFLGIQVQCTQCHDHPFNDWKQDQFWGLNAFFRQTRALRRFRPGTNEIAFVELANEDFGGEGNQPEQAEIYFEQRNSMLKVAYPVFVDGTPLKNRSGFVSDVNRRDELAKMIVGSSYLAPAVVNRIWAHFLGYGFTKPIDDFGPHNPPSHPELLDELSRQLVSHRYDLRQLITWIVLSRPYSLSSRVTRGNATDDPEISRSAWFSHFYLRQMSAESLYESLRILTAGSDDASGEPDDSARDRWLRRFYQSLGTDEGDEATTFNGTIPQVLMMFNGDLVKNATRLDTDNVLSRVVGGSGNPKSKMEQLYLAAFARKPTKSEIRVANQLLIARRGDAVVQGGNDGPQKRLRNGSGSANKQSGSTRADDPAALALQDIWWAMLNSNEFLLVH